MKAVIKTAGVLASVLVAAVSLFWTADGRADDKKCAMVLLHGKWGNPDHLMHFGRRMQGACHAKTIEMPWSQRRIYDQPYPVALQEIAKEVSALRAQGYQRIILAGHSFGANAVTAYMTVYGDADGVISMGPGHSPNHMYNTLKMNHQALEQARSLVAQGKGDELVSIEDYNQKSRRSIRMKAISAATYFDPDGLGNQTKTSSAFKKSVPFLLVVGSGDPIYKFAEGAIFKNTPPNPSSKLLRVNADHMNTPDVAVEQVKEWIKSLP
jgi:pimeloyl-ACP methyl ester carboxylesterase